LLKRRGYSAIGQPVSSDHLDAANHADYAVHTAISTESIRDVRHAARRPRVAR